MTKVPENVKNKKLYQKVKGDAKKTFKRYPSLYASSWITREYKKRGGKYNETKETKQIKETKDGKDIKKITKRKENLNGQARWYKEQWIQIIPYLESEKIVKCGDNNKDSKACRALKRVNANTPPTINEIIKKYGKTKVLKLSNQKNKDMKGRLNWINGTFTPSKERLTKK